MNTAVMVLKNSVIILSYEGGRWWIDRNRNCDAEPVPGDITPGVYVNGGFTPIDPKRVVATGDDVNEIIAEYLPL